MDLSGGNYMARGLKPPGLKQKFYLPASFFPISLDKVTEFSTGCNMKTTVNACSPIVLLYLK